MKLTTDTMVRLHAAALEIGTLSKSPGVINISGFMGESTVHMTDEAFLNTFDTYNREAFTEDYDKILVMVGKTKFFALVKPND